MCHPHKYENADTQDKKKKKLKNGCLLSHSAITSLYIIYLNCWLLTQFFLFFFLFLASASMLEPTLEWLVALATLLTLSEECCLLMRRSGCWFCCCCCCCCGLPLLPARETEDGEKMYGITMCPMMTFLPDMSIQSLYTRVPLHDSQLIILILLAQIQIAVLRRYCYFLYLCDPL